MKRELLILRHGKSDWASGAMKDFDRPLAKRGRKAVKRIVAWALANDLAPGHVLSSPAERARQTTKRFCRGVGITTELIQYESDLYLASVESILAHLQAIPEGLQRVMVVGHNPGMEALVEYLRGAPASDSLGPVSMPAAALARFDMPEDWRYLECGCAQLLSITYPRQLSS